LHDASTALLRSAGIVESNAAGNRSVRVVTSGTILPDARRNPFCQITRITERQPERRCLSLWHQDLSVFILGADRLQKLEYPRQPFYKIAEPVFFTLNQFTYFPPSLHCLVFAYVLHATKSIAANILSPSGENPTILHTS
jgi:hypothetical protein